MLKGIHPVTVALSADERVLKTMQRAAARFEKLNGVAPQIVTLEDAARVEAINPVTAILRIWDLVPASVEAILYYDWYCIPARKLEDIAFDRFAMVTDAPGLFLARRNAQPVFDWQRELNEQSHGPSDLTPTSVLHSLAAADYTQLPKTWNFLVLKARNPLLNPRVLNFRRQDNDDQRMDRDWRILDGVLDVFDAAEEQHAPATIGQE